MKKGERFINLRPAVILAAGIISGIISAYIFVFYSSTVFFALWVVYLSVFIFLFIIFSKNTELFNKKTITVIASFILCISGAFSGITVHKNYEAADVTEKSYTVSGKITAVSGSEDSTDIILGDLVFEDTDDFTSRYKMVVSVNADSYDMPVKPGDYISFTAVIKNLGTVYNDRPSVSYLSDGIKYSAKISSFSEIKFIKSRSDVFAAVSNFLNNSLKKGLKNTEEYGIAKGLILGGGGNISDETLSTFRFAGVAHIFAVSGLHIAFLAGILSFVIKVLKIKKPIGAIITVISMFFYSGVCGFTVSSLRAAVMFSVMSVVDAAFNKYDPISSVAFAGTVLLAVFPYELFGAGFLLSFGTTLSLILLTDPIKRIFAKAIKFCFFRNGKKEPVARNPHVQELSDNEARLIIEEKIKLEKRDEKIDKISAVSAVPIASLLGATPLSVYFFGYFSSVSAAVNVIFVPIISLLFPFVILGAVIGGIFNISGVTLFIPKIFIRLIRIIMWRINAAPLAVSLPFYFIPTIIFYLALLFFSGIFNIGQKANRIITITLILVSIISSVSYTVYYDNSVKLKTYYDGYVSATLVTRNDTDILIVTSETTDFYFIKNIVKEVKDGVIENVVVLNKSSDVKSVIRGMKDKIKILSVSYFGGANTDYPEIYFGIPLSGYDENEITEFQSAVKGGFTKLGYGYSVSAGGKNFLILSDLPEGNVYPLLPDNDYDRVIFTSCEKFVKERYRASRGVYEIKRRLKPELYNKYRKNSCGITIEVF